MAQRLSADIARENKEPLYGTIKSSDVWLLLEYNGVYTNQAWEDARIPDEVKAKLDSYPNSRALLVRQPEQVNAHDRLVSLFLIDAVADDPAIYQLEFQSYEDILDLDLDALRAGEVIEAEDHPMYVICTNGKRDMCCSKYGVALYNAMIQRAHKHVWQASHIGGHRFAGTMYCFPDALCYGFLQADDSETVIQSYEAGRILLDKLRGHAVYPKSVQAAEYFLRLELDNNRIEDVAFVGDTELDGKWSVDFSVNNVGYRVHLSKGTPLQVIATTGDETFKTVPQFKLVSIEQV